MKPRLLDGPMAVVQSALSLLSLREVRRQLRRPWARPLALLIAAVYAVVSMIVGEMLTLEPVGGADFAQVVWGSGGYRWWDYPGLLVVQPWGVLALPFLPTVTMVLVAAGVGVGATTGVLFVLPLLTRARTTASAAGGAAAGVGPAITGLATLGACCCTSCVGAAGITVVAAASGSSLNQLLLNDWYLGVFQVAVVYLALVAQERSVRLGQVACPPAAATTGRAVVSVLLRLALLISGITWSLAMLVEWSETSPLGAPAGLWYHWIFEHQLLAVVAFLAGMFPQEFADGVLRIFARRAGTAVRAVLLVSAVTWGLGVPPFALTWGLGGLLNEALGAAGVSAASGGIAPDLPFGPALIFHWGFQHLLLAGFAASVALAPSRLSALLLGTRVPRPAPTPTAAGSRSRPPVVDAAPTARRARRE